MSGAKERILATAAQLFTERGYELVGINELIEKSGVAKATFYQHFRSKESLCAEWLRLEAAESQQDATALLNAKIPARQKLIQKFDNLRDYLKSADFRGCPFSNTASVVIEDNTVRNVVDKHKAGVRLFWHSLAAQMRKDPLEARALGDGLFLLYSGAITETQNAKDLWPVESAKAAALALCEK